MAPRKRASSGGKKPSNPNRELLQSQPSKFGIQHFFERHSHSQSQKTLSQKKNDDPTADSAANQNSHIVPEPMIVNRAEAVAENPGCIAGLGKTGPRTKYVEGENHRSNSVNAIVIDVDAGTSGNARSRNDEPVVNHIGASCESSAKKFVDGVVGIIDVEKAGNLLKAEVPTQSQDDTPTDNLLPVVIDYGDNLMEASPEASKSASVKHLEC